MAIYEINSDHISEISETTFSAVGLHERKDLQRLLRAQVEIIAVDTLVIAEEFGDWEESKRRIDLLGIDKQANLVVIELKRTEDGGYMDLQAIRYAAMVSTMTFEKAVEVFGRHIQSTNKQCDARQTMLEFLDWEEPDEEQFGQAVRIVLASAEFSKELTTSVLWLNEQGLDIFCIRLKPYVDGTRVLLDVQQVIPLPEAQQYQIQVREKEQREKETKREKVERFALRKTFWRGLLERSSGKTSLFANVSPCRDTWIQAGSGISSIHYSYVIRQRTSAIEVVLEGDKETNKARFDWLRQRQGEVHDTYGGSLEWCRRDNLKKSYLRQDFEGGYRDDSEQWPAIQDRMIDAMARLEKAVAPYMSQLRQIGPTSGGQMDSPDSET